jgi:DNA-directed RNA polymerase specialized sigma24 family protein/ribosome-associated translation inhibitor RaiA
MNVHISYKVHKTPDIEKEINHLLEKLRKRLQVFRPELVHLKGIVEEGTPRVGCMASLNLRLPSGQMAAQHAAPTSAAAIRAAFDDLLQQVTKHKDLLRNSHTWTRRRTGNGRPQPQVPFEQTMAALPPSTASTEDVRFFVNANLGRLERFVERELYFRETAEQIPQDCITKDEVLDEAVARALGDGGDKPERMGLEAWLYRLAIHAMNDLASSAGEYRAEIHLEDSVRTQNMRASDEPHLQFHQPDETLTEESVIADRRIATPEDIASSEEVFSLVQYALRKASRHDREAFLLHTMEGFSIAEVAAITGDAPEKVHSSISAARAHLRQTAPFAERFRETTLHKTGLV